MNIQLKDVRFQYACTPECAVRGVTFHVQPGEKVAIIGESGCGKSTILRLIAGLEFPGKGTIILDDRIVADEKRFVPPEQRGVGYVFQDYALFPHMTVADNITFGLRRMSQEAKEKRLNTMLELICMEAYAKRYPHELSGGQQQRVALARALAPQPAVLLLDEPFSNLDRMLQRAIRQQLCQMVTQIGITTLFVTHDPEDTIGFADRVLQMTHCQLTELPRPARLPHAEECVPDRSVP